jgi:SAM-dependent methyltransferase
MTFPGFALKQCVHAMGLVTAPARNAARRKHGIMAPANRASFIRGIGMPALEIGPFGRPALAGQQVFYFDIASQDELRERALSDPDMLPENCPFIHYVSPTGSLEIVDRKFPAVFSSHVIEHQTDLIRHLEEVANVLSPGGSYYLIVPDKRYCFDHFAPESTYAEVVEAMGRNHHTEKTIKLKYLRTHNDPRLHWVGIHGKPEDGDPAIEIERVRNGYMPGDVHAWQFTPLGFHSILRDLHGEGLVRLRPQVVHDTRVGDLEFMAVLVH